MTITISAEALELTSQTVDKLYDLIALAQTNPQLVAAIQAAQNDRGYDTMRLVELANEQGVDLSLPEALALRMACFNIEKALRHDGVSVRDRDLSNHLAALSSFTGEEWPQEAATTRGFGEETLPSAAKITSQALGEEDKPSRDGEVVTMAVGEGDKPSREGEVTTMAMGEENNWPANPEPPRQGGVTSMALGEEDKPRQGGVTTMALGEENKPG